MTKPDPSMTWLEGDWPLPPSRSVDSGLVLGAKPTKKADGEDVRVAVSGEKPGDIQTD